MSKISLKDIKNLLSKNELELISTSYKNLDTPLEIKCLKGHFFEETYRNLRKIPICPICTKENTMTIVSKNKEKIDFRVLGLDQATKKTGWALFEDDELINHGIYSVPDDFPKEKRIWLMGKELIEMIKKYEPDLVVLEDIQLQDSESESVYNSNIGVITFKTLAELLGVLTNILFESKVDYKIVPPGVWRKHSQVKGRSRADKKKSAQLIVKNLYNILVKNDESDAILIAKYVAETIRTKKSNNNHNLIKW